MFVLAFEFRAASEVVELAELLILLMWNAGHMVPRTLILLLADAANVNQTDLLNLLINYRNFAKHDIHIF